MDEDRLPLIDRAFLATQTGGDPALAAEVLGLFAAQCTRLVPMLADDALPAREREDAAHTLRGAARAIGAERVAALACEVETALRSGQAESGLPCLCDALARAAEATRAAAA